MILFSIGLGSGFLLFLPFLDDDFGGAGTKTGGAGTSCHTGWGACAAIGVSGTRYASMGSIGDGGDNGTSTSEVGK